MASVSLLCIPLWAHASGGYGVNLDKVIGLLEVPIPDLRVEVVSSNAFVTLSLPVHLALLEASTTHYQPLVSLFAEPQWRPSGNEWRGIAGLRLTQPVYRTFALIAETGGLVGTDGHGVVFGGGFGFLQGERMGFLAPMSRYVYSPSGSRYDFTVDILYYAF